MSEEYAACTLLFEDMRPVLHARVSHDRLLGLEPYRSTTEPSRYCLRGMSAPALVQVAEAHTAELASGHGRD